MDTSLEAIVTSPSQSLIHLYGCQYLHESVIKILDEAYESKSKQNERSPLRHITYHIFDLISMLPLADPKCS